MRRRSGFTLVEVLVAMALILFIMSILAAAFSAAMQAVSDFKAAGDLAEKLRGASVVLRRDLEAYHCYDINGNALPISSVFGTAIAPNPPPVQGFFRIYQQTQDVSEGNDLDGIPSYHQTSTVLHYTITLTGIRRHDFLSALVPNGSPLLSTTDLVLGPPDERYQDSPSVYNSPSAEVAVFLVPNGDQTDGTNGPAQPLFTLCRRQFLTVPPAAPNGATPPVPWVPNPPIPAPNNAYLEVSTVPSAPETAVPPAAAGNMTFNRLQDLTMPVRRFSMDRTNPAGVYGGYLPSPGQYATMGQSNGGFQSADLVLSDVVSFDVRVLLKGGADFVDLFDQSVQAYSNNNPAFSATGAPNGPRVFDTWSSNPTADTLTGVSYATSTTPGAATSIPLYEAAGTNGPTPISIQAIQITLRVWDFKTKKTRQVTIVQQM